MATCDVGRVIAPLAGETDSGAHRDAAVSSAVYRPLSSHRASNALNLPPRPPTGAPPAGSLLGAQMELVYACVCVCLYVCVLMRKQFLRVSFCICIYVHISVLACESTSASEPFPLHVCVSHSCFRKLFKQLACNMAPLCMCVYVCVSLPVFDCCIYRVVSLCARALC